MSVLIYADKMPCSQQDITFYVGKAIKKYLDDLTGLDLTIKLPNDIYYEGKKLCGILTELVTRGNITYGAVGIGVNVNNTYFPDEIANIATSLALISRKEYDIETIGRDISYAISN